MQFHQPVPKNRNKQNEKHIASVWQRINGWQRKGSEGWGRWHCVDLTCDPFSNIFPRRISPTLRNAVHCAGTNKRATSTKLVSLKAEGLIRAETRRGRARESVRMSTRKSRIGRHPHVGQFYVVGYVRHDTAEKLVRLRPALFMFITRFSGPALSPKIWIICRHPPITGTMGLITRVQAVLSRTIPISIQGLIFNIIN